MGDEFLPGLQESFKQQQHSVTDPNIGLFINHFPGSSHHDHHPLTGFPLDNIPFPQSPQNTTIAPLYHHQILTNHKKRKPVETTTTTPVNSPANSSPQISDNIGNVRKKSVGRGKKVKGDEMEEEKPREVVHVRAKRGQATDSHSLAERVRREKINERLRCLQDIVPGCYKTMGMAVMLDEIINYVQSLQNQVEFLSMKLTAASTFYDFNSENEALEAMQRAKAFQAIKGQTGANGLTPSQLASLCLNFGCSPQGR